MHQVDSIRQDISAFRRSVHQGLPYKPLYVKLKLVWQCNLRCKMCNHWREKSESPLPFSFYQQLIDELATMGCQKIHLTGGEPTLRSDLEDIIQHIRDRQIRPTMTTNGTKIDANRAYSLAQAGLRRVNISLDSPDPYIHDRIRGVKNSWSKAVRGFQFLRPWLRPGAMQINTVINALNYQSLKDLPDFAQSLGADRINLIALDEHTDDLQRLTQAQIEDYNQNIAPIIAQKGQAFKLIAQPQAAYPFGINLTEIKQSASGYYDRGYYANHPCFAPWTHVLIDHIGRVSLCCMLPNKPVIGDLGKASFKEVWTGKELAELRRTDHLPLFENCRSCDMFLENNKKLEKLVFQRPFSLFNLF